MSQRSADQILQGYGCAYTIVWFGILGTKIGGFKAMETGEMTVPLGCSSWTECVLIINKLH